MMNIRLAFLWGVKTLGYCVVLAGTFVVAGARLFAGEASISGTTGLAETGRELFAIHCAMCHQPEASGKVGFAPSIRNRDFLALASDEFIHKTISAGRPGTAMVPRPDLGGEQVDAIVAFLRSVPAANPVHVEVDWETKFDDGNSESGADLYATYCASCHGANGEGYIAGVPGTAIGLRGFLAVASDDYILQTLKLGRIGTPMQPFIGARGLANLSEGDAHDIIAHLRELGRRRPSANQVARPPNPALGKQQYDINCSGCHQVGGVGKVGFAPGLANQHFLAIASDDFIRKTVLGGRPGTAMLARPDLNTQTVNDIISYLRSIPTGNIVDVSVDTSLSFNGDAAKGSEKFDLYCASCHGAKGEGYIIGVPGPAIGLPGFLNIASDDYIYQTLKHGRSGTPMRSFLGSKGLANLSQQDAFDIISHLRILGKTAVTSSASAESDFE